MNRLSGLTNHKHACKYHKDIVQQRVVDCSTVGLESLIQYTKVTYEKCYGSPMKLSILSGYHKKICCGCFLVFSLNPQVSFHICKNGKKKNWSDGRRRCGRCTPSDVEIRDNHHQIYSSPSLKASNIKRKRKRRKLVEFESCVCMVGEQGKESVKEKKVSRERERELTGASIPRSQKRSPPLLLFLHKY